MSKRQQEAERRRDLALLRSFLVDGMSEAEIRERIDYPRDELAALRAQLLEHEAEDIRGKSTEGVYADYVIAQGRNVRDLTKLVSEFVGETKTAAARVSAIKARSEIYDRIIARGQEFGLVAKKPEAKIVAGVLVENLTNRQLREAITEELQYLGGMMSRFGETDIVDVDPGELYRPTPKAKALPPGNGKPRTRASNKVHKGRRVVKDPLT